MEKGKTAILDGSQQRNNNSEREIPMLNIYYDDCILYRYVDLIKNSYKITNPKRYNLKNDKAYQKKWKLIWSFHEN